MTLEYIISNAEPSDATSGTSLNNTAVMSVLPLKYSNVLKQDTSISGLPIVRMYGQKSPVINFVLHVLETGVSVADETLGLTDLDKLRQIQIGLDSGVTGKHVWLRDTAGEYFIRHWKGGFIDGLGIDIKLGYNNIVTDTLYIVSFKLVCPLNLGNNHTLLRWI